ncbi:ferric reductase-like transmembrane domain-containing protein [Streptomyces netropsis]|uniref:ferric reductase-like transmembrane domain-containing protein n=1 Tax=Streptomyces netropsis TaxID=55404 RepID=UPI0037AB7A23
MSPDAASASGSEEGVSEPDGAHRRGRAALKTDARSAVPDVCAALAVTATVFLFLFARMRSGESSTVAVMPFMKDPGTYWMYLLSQAFGWAGLLWAWITIMLGLLLSGPHPGRLPVSRAGLERWHRITSLTTMALMLAHALMFAAELVRYEAKLTWTQRFWDAFVDTFVPGGYSSGTGRLAIPIGQGALYLAIPLGLLFYTRHRIGLRTWRRLHRFVIVVYVLSVWHTLLYGTNVWYAEWPRTALWLLQLPVAALLLLRLLRPARRAERLTWPGRRGDGTDRTPPPRFPAWAARVTGRVAVGAVLVGLVAVVASGHDGGRERPAPAPSPQAPHDHGSG